MRLQCEVGRTEGPRDESETTEVWDQGVVEGAGTFPRFTRVMEEATEVSRSQSKAMNIHFLRLPGFPDSNKDLELKE